VAALIQFNVEYVSVEDRLRLRMRHGDTEFLLWLTRRYTKLLLNVLEKIAGAAPATDGSELAKQAAKEFQRDAALEDADFETAYEETATEHPLGEAPLLLSRVTYAIADNGQVKLTLAAQDEKSVNANLSPKMLHILSAMLLQAAKKAEWGLEVEGAAGAAYGETAPSIH
jgi:hypothetical protein